MAPVQFGNYQIMRKIGAGGMAQVFEAQRVGLEGFSRRVALKCILPEMTRDQRFVEMFVNEARLGSQLHHPNIVEIQDFNKVNDIYYIAMEFVEGVDLGEVISRFRSAEREFPPGLAISILLQALDGLGYAHEATTDDGATMSIIHRDIKPSNLLLTRRGTVKIADFGIAKAATNAYQTRTSEVTKGSLAYMAPEQITREAPVSPASDLFSLGAVLFEMLSLRALFDGENMPSIMFKVAQVEIERDLSELEAVHPEFIPILKKALARDVASRYRTAAEMAADLRPLLDRFPPGPSIQDLASEFIKPHSHEEDSWVGENTASLLGFSSNPLMGAGNLALHSTSQPGVHVLSPVGSNPTLHNPMYVPELESSFLPESLQEEVLQPPPPVAAPARRLRGPLMAVTTLLLLVLAGAGLAVVSREKAPATVMVTSSPLGAQILIDGRLQTRVVGGQVSPLVTPARLPLPEGGAAELSLEMEGFEPFTSALSYNPGQAIEMAPTLKQKAESGALEITSIPSGAEIELNGRRLEQKTPVRLENLPGGARYEVSLKLAGYTPTSGSVEIRNNSTATFAATLVAPPPAAVRPTPIALAPTTGGAGKAHDRTPAAPASNRPVPVSREPEPVSQPASGGIPGTLVVSAVPPDCVVFIDGARKGNAPVSLQLPPGAHKVRLERFDGTTAKEFTVQVASSQETTRVWDLEGRQFISE